MDIEHQKHIIKIRNIQKKHEYFLKIMDELKFDQCEELEKEYDLKLEKEKELELELFEKENKVYFKVLDGLSVIIAAMIVKKLKKLKLINK